ncbi:murein L,D-transpeptidase catalytic domain family protein [Fibrella forsythiae]|uniref:Murein L,D-transpeptidase catalytic domain family protein n=1 Tax=Fibrella forsythiae TaxID=2817061 RepID=A0ABS3JDP1_9BACT|nr:murein L,D-transpeptidase catalytic domain family protein [Fibrella forsythiae]MBO0948112.1 murein L,D-transpeptidase catalytic domain family protein [Fibrella forsythiae]
MKYVACLLVLILGCTSLETKVNQSAEIAQPVKLATGPLYDSLGLAKLGLNPVVFDLAWRGMQLIPKTKPLLLIADMTKPSSEKRLYVLDLKKKLILFHTYVAHGRHSGGLLATQFSNEINSNQTSLGFYRTMGRYHGKHGLSLKLKGLEKGVNDNVFSRNIVLHGADYVSEDTVRLKGQLGHSEGCPAIPNAVSMTMVKTVEGGACLFVYYPDPTYLRTSSFVNTHHPTNTQ